MKVFLAIVLLFVSFADNLMSQQLENLTPQPRCAYIRQELSAIFSIENVSKIVISDEVPQEVAEKLIAELRLSGVNIIADIRKLSDDPNPSNAIILGISSAQVNLLINSYGGQYVNVNKDYPGEEGYCLDIMPMRCIINGSDERGLFYGIITLNQMLRQSKSLFACRIVDAPEFPVRWLYYPMNFLVGANTTKAKTIWETSYRNKLNGAMVADYKFDFNTSMPTRYGDSIFSMKKFAKSNYIDFVLACMPFGYSNSIMFNNPNLASGLPVQNQKFYIEGDTGRIVPSTNVTLPNPGFENRNGDNFPGFAFIDAPGQFSYADNSVKHSGTTSIRFSNFESNANYKNARVTYRVKVKPFTQFHASAWVKSENLTYSYRFQIMAIGNKGRALCYQNLDLPATSDWKKYDVTFNSLDADTITVYWGVWGPEKGKFWLDDLVLEEASFVNLIRRDGAPLSISHTVKDLVYREGIDCDSIIDTKMGRVYGYGGDYDYWHQPPSFKIKKNSAIQNGDTLLLSYYHTTVIYDGQVMATTAEDEVYDIIKRELRSLDSIAKPEQFFMSHDEIRVLNWDAGETAKGMTPGQLLAENVNKCYDIIRDLNTTAKIWTWSDMFDIYHNAAPGVKNYYLVNGDLSGSAELINKKIGIANWNFGKADQSLKYFSDLGFDQITAPFYDQDQNAIRVSKETSQGIKGFKGMMYTTWASNFNYLEHHGWYSWNHAPFIYHQPPNASDNPRSMTLEFTIKGDKWDSGWKLDSAFVYYRFSNNGAFTKAPVYESNGSFRFHFEMTGMETFLQYYIEAVDNRKWKTKVPFGDSKYYEFLWTDVLDYENLAVEFNPLLSSIEIKLLSETQFDYVLFDVLSQSCLSGSANAKIMRIDLSNLSNGLYFIKIKDKHTNTEIIKKFIKF